MTNQKKRLAELPTKGTLVGVKYIINNLGKWLKEMSLIFSLQYVNSNFVRNIIE